MKYYGIRNFITKKPLGTSHEIWAGFEGTGCMVIFQENSDQIWLVKNITDAKKVLKPRLVNPKVVEHDYDNPMWENLMPINYEVFEVEI